MKRRMKTYSACGKRKLVRLGFYKRAAGCKSGAGLPYSECKSCHHERTNENRRRLRVTSSRFRRAEKAARVRYAKKQKRATSRRSRR